MRAAANSSTAPWFAMARTAKLGANTSVAAYMTEFSPLASKRLPTSGPVKKTTRGRRERASAEMTVQVMMMVSKPPRRISSKPMAGPMAVDSVWPGDTPTSADRCHAGRSTMGEGGRVSDRRGLALEEVSACI
jgi:hypothetical protein